MFFKSDKQVKLDELLHVLIKSNTPESQRMAIDCITNGADLSCVIDEYTAIERAAKLKQWDLVIAIAKKKNDVTGSYRYIEALKEAIINHVDSAAEALIEANADLDEFVHHIKSWTILHVAVYEGNLPIVKLIVKKLPDLLDINILWIPQPLALAAEIAHAECEDEKKAKQYWDITLCLISSAKEQVNKEFITLSWETRYGFDAALNFTARSGPPKVMKALMDTGMSLGSWIDNKSALYVAAKYNNTQIANWVLYHRPELEKGSIFRWDKPKDINKDLMEKSLLWAKNTHNYIKISRFLLEAVLSPGSVFSQPGVQDLLPQFVMKLMLAMAEELNFDAIETQRSLVV